MDRVFLDANVLFSAAYRSDSKLRELWRRRGVELLTSAYAAEEARRNLDTIEQRETLERLLAEVTAVADAPDRPLPVELPDKDRPILAAAIEAGATHLLTGDLRDFGPFLGQAAAGVLILLPADYLRGPAPAGKPPRQRHP